MLYKIPVILETSLCIRRTLHDPSLSSPQPSPRTLLTYSLTGSPCCAPMRPPRRWGECTVRLQRHAWAPHSCRCLARGPGARTPQKGQLRGPGKGPPTYTGRPLTPVNSQTTANAATTTTSASFPLIRRRIRALSGAARALCQVAFATTARPGGVRSQPTCSPCRNSASTRTDRLNGT